MKIAFLFFVLLGTSTDTLAQRVVRGEVRNGETGEVLPFANVFLANTTKGTTTDETGKFHLLNLPAGRYDLVVSYVGYETFSFVIQTDTSRFYRILLKPQSNQLATVTVRARRGPDWAANLHLFRENFIGKSRNAQRCRLLNPDVLWFNDSDSVLTGGAREPLMIENRALGYRLRYQLEAFRFDRNRHYTSYMGFPVFEEMSSRNERERRRWIANRRAAYYGSTMHFMRAMHHRKLLEEGFVVRRIRKTSSGTFLSRDTLKYEQFIDLAGSDAQHTRLKFSDFIQVMFPRENEDRAYQAQRFGFNGQARNVPQTSVLQLVDPYLTVEANGNFYEPLGLLFEGYWSWEKTAELLPLDYEPEE